MNFRIADTFTDSLARLTGDEQKAVKTTAFDLQLNPASPGMQFHRLDAVRDPNFWSVRVSRDTRLIVHRSADSLLLCHVDHHDKAYQWAQRRKLETHPKTRAAQLVEIRETVREITDHLPAEAAEALLELATGGQPRKPAVAVGAEDSFDHPDAQRRFRVMADADQLARALEYPWDKWTVFLHPAQREMVEKDYKGPARVSGSAGTGKTIVALHRAVHLARNNPDARVLLTTFSDTLANALSAKLRRLIGNESRLGERLEVHAIDAIGEHLYTVHVGRPEIAARERIREMLSQAADGVESLKVSVRFLLGEWEDVVDAWQLQTWEDYRDVGDSGRSTHQQ
jgi:mRNA-degrading endonuclease RelE of RelBE toxin-antitoxin system